MIRFGMEKSSDQDPAAEGAAAAEAAAEEEEDVAEALIDACVGCRPSHNLCFVSNGFWPQVMSFRIGCSFGCQSCRATKT